MNTYDCIFFDLDSTLVTIEGLDWLAEHKGKGEDVKHLTLQSMNGSLSVGKAMKQKMAILQPNRQDLTLLGEIYCQRLVKDAKETIEALQFLNKKISIVTGGFAPAPHIVAKTLGIPEKNILSNTVYFDEKGNYSGFDEDNPLGKNGGKKTILESLMHNDNKTVFIGDAVTDLEAKSVVDLFIGYGGVIEREKVKQSADIYISKRTLAAILPIVTNKAEKQKLLCSSYKFLLQKAE